MQDDQMKLEDLSIDDLIRVAEQDMITAPHYLKDNIMNKSQSVQVQLPMQIEVHTKRLSKRMQMFCYTMKISAAMVCALILLLVVPNIQPTLAQGYNGIKQPIVEKTSEITTTFTEKRSNFKESVDEIKDNLLQTINGGNKNE